MAVAISSFQNKMPTRILACYVDMHPQTREALALYAPEAELVDVSYSVYGYWQEIEKRWTGECDLILVEQDVVITKELLDGLRECEHHWCCCWYAGPPMDKTMELRYTHRDMLGFTKFSAHLQNRIPFSEFRDYHDHYSSEKLAPEGARWDKIDEMIRYRLYRPQGPFPPPEFAAACGHPQVMTHHAYEVVIFDPQLNPGINGGRDWIFYHVDKTYPSYPKWNKGNQPIIGQYTSFLVGDFVE